jgi:hypothetical protein
MAETTAKLACIYDVDHGEASCVALMLKAACNVNLARNLYDIKP